MSDIHDKFVRRIAKLVVARAMADAEARECGVGLKKAAAREANTTKLKHVPAAPGARTTRPYVQS